MNKDARAALKELVACKDLKDRIDAAGLYPGQVMTKEQRDEAVRDYYHRQPGAWAAARAVLANPPNDAGGGNAELADHHRQLAARPASDPSSQRAATGRLTASDCHVAPASPSTDDALVDRLRGLHEKLGRHGSLTFQRGDEEDPPSLFKECADAIAELRRERDELRHKVQILLDPDDEPSAGDFECTR